MADVVYALCALTSLLCAVLLIRGYRATRVRLLLWSGICFACLAVSNLFLVIDLSVEPDRDLSLLRSVPVVIGLGALVYGLVWDAALRRGDR